MAGARAGVAAELSRIAGEFPGWRPWVSDAGRWWATRKGRRPADLPEWWAMTVDADDAQGLQSAIAEQARLASPVGAVSSGMARLEPARSGTRAGSGPAASSGAGGR
ncbi:MAG: hypothetical protein ACRDOI_10300 [Trebonia sp.]